MGCSNSTSVRRSTFKPSSRPCKTGYMVYSDGSNKWKKVFVVLFQDSMIAWFESPKKKTPIAYTVLKDVCSMLVVGPVCKRIPNSPQKIPKKLSFSYMIAFPQ
ncbi:hypothetical protein DPMN_097053 [Dreissena polymorpha]|uniref:Uncharacterized protein n=1 Tax=Dreissena polymorpha TaxID=45954 RepID=A0A9D4L9K3_DREPO|nr:hypothetical protein DPMN_097053 [Dreissena polymorpha]